jgi:hypothetical protein
LGLVLGGAFDVKADGLLALGFDHYDRGAAALHASEKRSNAVILSAAKDPGI